MADVTEDLRIPSLAQVKELIDDITASDIGALPINGSVAMKNAIPLQSVGTSPTDKAYVAGNDKQAWLGVNNATLSAAFAVKTNYSGGSAIPITDVFSVHINSVDYPIFSKHNKPIGTYTGNGSATKRVINVNGIAGAVLIRASDGNSWGLLHINGGVVADYSSNALTRVLSGEAVYNGASITLNSTKQSLNANGVTYTYYAL